MTGFSFGIVWEGIERNAWNELHYEEIQLLLKDTGYEERVFRAFNFEILFTNSICEAFKDYGAIKLEHFQVGTSEYWDFCRFYPDGIWESNKARGSHIMFNRFISPLKKRSFVDKTSKTYRFKKEHPRNMLAIQTIPYYMGINEGVARLQGLREMVRLSCAIEQYRLTHSNIPNVLNDLNPEFINSIPIDLMDPEHPLKYRPNHEENGYLIYSIGLNRIDDGGKVAWTKSGKGRNKYEGDWVWSVRYPLARN